MPLIDLGPADEKENTGLIDLGPADSGVFNEKTAASTYDLSQESGISLDESEAVHNELGKQAQPQDGLVKRFGKQLSNFTITSLVRGITASPLSPIGIPDKEVQKYELEALESIQSENPDFTGYATEPGRQLIKSEAKKIAAARRYEGFAVKEAETLPEKGIDTIAGVAGFMVQLAILKRVAPSMPDAVAWDVVSQASGGGPGSGAAMQMTLGGINRAIPGAGFFPAAGRAGGASALFGTTTYLGGGDTEDILINMGLPFAFEGMNITRQSWAKYKNKAEFIATLKKKAPGLNDRSDVEIDKIIGDMLTNIEPVGPQKPKTSEDMGKEFAPKTTEPEISEQVRAYMQEKRYSELLEKANAGDKKAIKELNDFVQGTNLPTYEELLNKAMSGDQKSVDLIQEGNYFGGPNATPELTAKETPTKSAKAKKGVEPTLGQVEQETRPTPVQRIRDNAPIIENDISTPVTIDPKDVAKSRERGFITSVKEVLPELKIEGQYIPRSTDQLAIKARNLIADDLAKAEKLAKTGNDQNAVATASELIKYYGDQAELVATEAAKAAYYDKAADIANTIAPKLTELGRAVQAASILGRLTPEGQVRFAAGEIKRYNEKVETKNGGLGGLRKKIPELTPEQAGYILGEMKEIAKMPDGKAKFVRFKKVQDYVSQLVPTPLYDKIITVWKAGLLTGIKTSGLNIMSNVFHLGTEVAKDIPATGVDKIISYFTGKRTVTPTIKGIKQGTIKGIESGIEYVKTGYSERDIGVKLDYVKINMGKGSLAKALQAGTDTMFRLIGAEDQPFYYAAKMRSFYEQAKVSAMNLGLKGQKAQAHIDNLIQNPTEGMIRYATKDAEAAVFINNTKLADIGRGIQHLPGGEIIVPFARTPAAVAMQVVNYSPIGIVKTIVENIGKGKFDQREFSQGLGRGLTGTAVLYIGAQLFKQGLITLDRPKDEREIKLWELEGRQPNSIKIGDKWRTVQSFGPAGNLLIIGGQFQRAFDENGSPAAAMAEALAGSAKSFTEQTFLKGINQFSDALADPQRSAQTLFGNLIASMIPTIVSDVARATDTGERRAESPLQKMQARIPGAREGLEPAISALGEERELTGNPLELMADPTRPSKDISTPVVAELRRLWDEGWEVSPTMLGDKKGFESLTPEQNTELWKRSGQITKQGLEQLISNELYSQLPDEKKAELIGKIIMESQRAARTEAVVKSLTGLEGKELTDKIFELRQTGLATESIIPIALSRRNPRKAQKERNE